MFIFIVFQKCRFIAHPVGKWYKIKENPPKIAKPNALLESAYKKFRRLPGKDEVLVRYSTYLSYKFNEILFQQGYNISINQIIFTFAHKKK